MCKGQPHLSFNFSALFILPLTCHSKCPNKVTLVAAALATVGQRWGGSISGSSTVTGCGKNSSSCSANTKYTTKVHYWRGPPKEKRATSVNKCGEKQGLKLVKTDFIPSRFRSCFNQEKLKVKTLQRHYNRELLASKFQMYKENVHRLAWKAWEAYYLLQYAFKFN